MFSKIVAYFMILSMSVNGFLPRSIVDLSGNTFLRDAIACQSVLFDFLRFSDRTIAELAVKTADDLSVAAPLPFAVHNEHTANPWIEVCRALEQSRGRLAGFGMTSSAGPAADNQNVPDPTAPSVNDTSADFSLLSNGDRSILAVRYYVRHHAGIAALLAVSSAQVLTGGVHAPPAGDAISVHRESLSLGAATVCDTFSAGRDIPVFAPGHFISFLPRSGIEASVIMRGTI